MKDEWCVREYLFKKQSLFSQFYMVTKSPSNNKDFRDITTVQHNTGFMSVQYGAYNMTKLFEFELCKFELLTSVI